MCKINLQAVTDIQHIKTERRLGKAGWGGYQKSLEKAGKGEYQRLLGKAGCHGYQSWVWLVSKFSGKTWVDCVAIKDLWEELAGWILKMSWGMFR